MLNWISKIFSKKNSTTRISNINGSKSWYLDDVEKIASNNPGTFFIPPKEDRINAKINDEVRLHFVLKNPDEDQPRAERMWVVITRENSSMNSYCGKLSSAPMYIKDLSPGDDIGFHPCNIAQTIIKKDDPRWIDSLQKSGLVSKLFFENGECIRFLYRENVSNNEDSGWRLFTGHETEEYNNNSKNIAIANMAYLLDKDPTLLLPFKTKEKCAFERVDINSPWVQVHEWNPDD